MSSEPNQYYILGPIDGSQPVIITMNVGNISYFLTVIELSTTPGFTGPTGATGVLGPDATTPNFSAALVFDSTVSAVPALFTVAGVPSGITLSTVLTNGSTGYITAGTDGTAYLQTISSTLFPINYDFDYFSLLLAGANYTFNIVSNIPNWSITQWWMFNPSSTSIIPPTQNAGPPSYTVVSSVRAIPIQWFPKGNCSQVVTVSNVPLYERQWAANGTISNYPPITQGFTDLPDCNANFWYSYCGPNIPCSTNCKGSCASCSDSTLAGNTSGLDCLYNSDTQQLSCQVPPETEPIFESEGFKYLLIFLAILFVIIIIVVISIAISKNPHGYD